LYLTGIGAVRQNLYFASSFLKGNTKFNLLSLALPLFHHIASRICKAVLLLVCLCFAQPLKLSAQDTSNADGLFAEARKAAFNREDYQEAVRLAKKALAFNDQYTDIVIFIGRLYTWSKNTDSGRQYLTKAIGIDPGYEDAYSAYSDFDFWNKDNEGALTTLNKGLVFHPQSEGLLMRKAKVLMAMKRFEEALTVSEALLAINKDNVEARTLNVTLNDLAAKSKLTIGAQYAHFDKQFPDDWLFSNIEFSDVSPIGPIAGRLNYANRFSTQAFQVETDIYPRLSKTFYLYLNAGYSGQIIVFPKLRGAASLFGNFAHGYEAEAGLRYLYYTTSIVFYTGYLGKYYKKLFFGIREYVTPSPLSYSNTTGLFLRYFFNGSDDYINFDATRGVLVDARWYNLSTYDNSKLPSYFVGLSVQKALGRRNLLNLSFTVSQQQYRPDAIGNQYQGGVSYTRRF
jgi:YaiO family outer membrane protein